MRKKIAFLTLLLTLLALPPTQASAETKCDFKKSLVDLQLVKSAETSDIIAEKELELRKAAISGILKCLITNTNQIYSDVEASPFVSRAASLRSKLLYELKGNAFYYEEKLKELEEADIKETKNMAKEILTWKKNHDANLERAHQYSVWAGNQSLLSAAEKRLGQISRLYFKSSKANMDRSHSLVFRAKDLNARAQATMENAESTEEAWSLIKNSLESMQRAYESFLEASKR